MKRVLWVAAVSGALLASACFLWFQSAPAYAKGNPRIKSTETRLYWSSFSVIAHTKDAKGKWLGCSVRNTDDRDNEIDKPAREVTSQERASWSHPRGSEDASKWEYIVKLWERKVEDPDSPNGYYMEGELDSTGWRSVQDAAPGW